MPWERQVSVRVLAVMAAVLVATLATLAPRVHADDAGEPDAATLLAGHGLKPVGRVWMLEEELQALN